MAAAPASGSKRLLAADLQSPLAYAACATSGETVFDPETGNVLVQVPLLDDDKLYSTEAGAGRPRRPAIATSGTSG